MDTHLNRAQLLIAQSRYEQAAAELRRQLADDPDNSLVHALLALCLIERKKYDEATAAARQAVHLAPDVAFAHYALAKVLYHRNRLKEAQQAITEAISLHNQDADNFALSAAIHFDQSRWADALWAAEQGLSCDPDNSGCVNLRAMSQVKLGQKAQADTTIGAALARDPEDALTHANQGWVLLEKREHLKAAEHFREALRLDPELEWARQGILEAIKAKNPIYRLMLRYFLWVAHFTPAVQWGILVGGFLGIRFLRRIGHDNPALRPYLGPVFIVYVAFAVMTWIAQPLFDLLLMFDRFGRHTLSPDSVKASLWLGGCLLLASIGVVACLVTGIPLVLPIILASLLLSIPLTSIWRCQAGWPRRVMALYTALLAGIGLLALVYLLLMQDAWQSFATLFLVGVIAAPWLANVLIAARPKH